VNWDEFEHIEEVGIDEIALKRGHRDYVTLVTVPLTPQGVAVIAILADRKKQTVMDFFQSIPTRLKETIQRVCTDMYQGFVAAAEAEVPQFNHFRPELLHLSPSQRPQGYQNLLSAIRELMLPFRPNRSEPRVLKRRPKPFPRMQESRSVAKARLVA
jgi:hypothetical protein